MESDIQTKYEIFTKLEDERLFLASGDVGHVREKETWARVDWLLDCLIDVEAIATLAEVV